VKSAAAGPEASAGRAFGLGPVGKDRDFFNYPKSFLTQKQIPENPKYVFKPRKMLRKL
jgi:hypothetical protein